MSYTLQNVYDELRKAFQGNGIKSANIDARILMSHFASCEKSDFIINTDKTITSGQYAALQLAMNERLSSKPVSKIIGEKEFYGRVFKVTEDTLDPRPETELIVDAVLKETRPDEAFTIIDVGTGTGCIILSILAERPQASGVAIDISEKALEIAKENANQLNLEGRVQFMRTSWLDGVVEKYDFLVSNPPYIPSDEIPFLEENVRNHDPHLALDGGNTGIYPYKKLLEKINLVLNPNGRAFFEIGKGQKSDLERLVAECPATLRRIIPDIAGIPRVVDISNGDK